MDQDAIAALNRLNQRFYSERAAAFARTRRCIWPGWERLWRSVQPILRSAAQPLVIDAGCGDGRFLRWLDEHHQGPLRAVALDFSAPLQAALRAQSWRDGVAIEAHCVDLLDDAALATAIGGRTARLVIALAVLHHLPGATTRMHVLQQLAARVAPGGLLAVSVWRFLDSGRIRARARPVDGAAEPGDYLLPFSDAGAAPRYCHHLDDAECDRLIATLPLQLIDDFAADGSGGRLNRYLLFARPGSPSSQTRP